MTSVLLVGDDGSQTYAGMGTGACIARTIRFRNALINQGFSVSVCSPAEGRAGERLVEKYLSEGSYDCVVAISPFPAEAAASTSSELPLWIDMNGMHPAELQLETDLDGRAGERMLRMLSLENMLLSRGDAFSTPSRRQAYCVYGELLILGRTMSTDKKQLGVFPIPHCSVEVPDFSRKSDDYFYIVSTGSFNLWFDEKVLFNALELAMEQDSRIRFEATGGRVPFSPEKYDLFCSMVAASRFKDRFVLHGWVSVEKLHSIYSKASIATYTDIHSTETILGARTRVLDWISRGIPIVCTGGAEISEDIERHEMGLVVPAGDSDALSVAFLSLAGSSSLRETITLNQEKWSQTHGASSHLFQPLFNWCDMPFRIVGKQYGEPTVPLMNSASYLKKIFLELVSTRGFSYSFKRFVRRILRIPSGKSNSSK